MKLLILANKQNWKSWNAKTEALKAWFSAFTELEVDVKKTSLDNVKFDGYIRTDNKKFVGLKLNDNWIEKNIVPLAKGYDVVILSMREKDWQGGDIQAKFEGTYGGIRVMALGSSEKGDYNFQGVKYPGDKWFNLARHELCHAIYDILGKQDNTHKHWLAGTIEQCLQEFKDTKPVVILKRNDYQLKQVLGTLTYGDFSCKTLERPWKNNQPNVSCIPTGTYQVEWTFSPKFARYTYEIKNVPGRTGIRIHTGNYFYQIQGCILPGTSYSDIDKDGAVDIINSKITLAKFESLMNKQSFTLQII
jgi:hypothetical protein